MRSDLLAAVDAFDRALAAAAELVDSQQLDPIAETVKATRARVGYLGDTLVGAVAGGTGSGKSSLINALAGEAVADSGGMRPTTSLPLAWIPANPEPGLVRLLDDLGIHHRVGQNVRADLALIDLPDTDSIVVDHRHTVEALLPRVDLVVWVLDPEKYQDRAIHERYLAPLSGYHRQFLFVLNQIDRLESPAVTSVVADLEGSLRAAGIVDPRVIPLAADPDVGPPQGIDLLGEALAAMAAEKRLVYDKLARDLHRAAATLTAIPDLGGSVSFGPRWEAVRGEAAAMLARGERPGTVRHLRGFLEELAGEVGGATGEAVVAEVERGLVEEAVEVAYESAGVYRPVETPPPPGFARPLRWGLVGVAMIALLAAVEQWRGGGVAWPAAAVAVLMIATWAALGAWLASRGRSRRAAAEEQRRADLIAPIERQLDSRLGRRLREILRRRAGAGAAATELSLALAELERRLESG